MAGRVTPLDSLAESRETLTRLEAQQGRPRTRITAMGLPPMTEFIETLLEHGVERMAITISSKSEASVTEQLERTRDAISAYC